MRVCKYAAFTQSKESGHDMNEKTTTFPKENGELYRARTGSLLHPATKSRLDLRLVARTLESHVANKIRIQLVEVKRTLLYLKETCLAGLHFNPEQYVQLSVNRNGNRSLHTNGKRRRRKCILSRNSDAVVCTVSALQRCISYNWMDAEYVALSEKCIIAAWMQ